MPQSEEAFYDALEKGASNHWKNSANEVREWVDNYRNHVKELKAGDEKHLILDEFDSEMVLGQHLEAVLSNTNFSS